MDAIAVDARASEGLEAGCIHLQQGAALVSGICSRGASIEFPGICWRDQAWVSCFRSMEQVLTRPVLMVCRLMPSAHLRLLHRAAAAQRGLDTAHSEG